MKLSHIQILLDKFALSNKCVQLAVKELFIFIYIEWYKILTDLPKKKKNNLKDNKCKDKYSFNSDKSEKKEFVVNTQNLIDFPPLKTPSPGGILTEDLSIFFSHLTAPWIIE